MRAIVLSGGGAKGAYEIGVWRGLKKLHIDYDIVTGTSVGALNGAFMVQRDYLHALWMWYHINFDMVTTEKIDGNYHTFAGLKSILKLYAKGLMDGGIDVSRLEQTINHYIKPKKFYRSPIRYGLVTVNLKTMKPMELTKEQIPKEQLKDYLMASATCFPAFKKKKIGEDTYIDGGYYDNLPINLAISLGATEVIAVDLKAVGFKQKLREYSIPVTYISPKGNLGSFLIFDEKLSRRAMKLGYQDTLKAFGKLDGNLYTFKSGELVKNQRKYQQKMIDKMKKLFYLESRGLIKELLTVSKYQSFFKGTKKVEEEMDEILDCLGRIFDINETKVYSLWEYQYCLKKEYKKVKPFTLSQIDDKIKNKNLENLFYSKTLFHYLMTKIKEQEKNDNKDFTILAAMFPKEMLAAIYMTVI